MIINPVPAPPVPTPAPETPPALEVSVLVKPKSESLDLAQAALNALTTTRAGRRILTEAIATAARTSQ